jgi:hypothetical protein
MWCREHRCGFTLYPPGHVPYGRQAVAPLNFDGGLVYDEDGALAWYSTAFGAAIAADQGVAWSRDDGSADYTGGGSDRWWSTQCRTLARLVQLVGVAPALDVQRRQRLSEVLVVALLVLLDHAARIGNRLRYRCCGRAVCAVVGSLPANARIGDRLAAAGWIAGLWGQPFRWEGNHLRPLYQELGTRGRPPP